MNLQIGKEDSRGVGGAYVIGSPSIAGEIPELKCPFQELSVSLTAMAAI